MALTKRNLSDCVSEFTLAMYQHMAADKPNDNVFLSPSNVAIVMTMVYIGARRETEDQMAKVLKLSAIDRSNILRQMERFLEKLERGNGLATLNTANRLFPHSDKRIHEDYVSTIRKYFKADVKQMDYTKESDKSRLEINAWVEKTTNNKIKNILPPGALTPLTAMVIVNTIYFKANWEIPFETKYTKTTDFIKLDASKIPVQMMRAKKMEDVRYGRDSALDCKVLKLPYEGDKIGMVIVLPNEVDGLHQLESKLSLKSLRGAVRALEFATVDVSLPKYKLESSIQLKKLLSDLGMTDVFDEDRADLTGTGDDLYVSEVYHKTFIDVNEAGTEAGAATAAVEVSRCLEETHRFNANHPFLFMIWHNTLDIPLFTGRFVEPKEVSQTSDQQKRERSHAEDERRVKKRK